MDQNALTVDPGKAERNVANVLYSWPRRGLSKPSSLALESGLANIYEMHEGDDEWPRKYVANLHWQDDGCHRGWESPKRRSKSMRWTIGRNENREEYQADTSEGVRRNDLALAQGLSEWSVYYKVSAAGRTMVKQDEHRTRLRVCLVDITASLVFCGKSRGQVNETQLRPSTASGNTRRIGRKAEDRHRQGSNASE